MNQFERWLLVEIAYSGSTATLPLWKRMDRGIKGWWRMVSIGKLFVSLDRLEQLGYIQSEYQDGEMRVSGQRRRLLVVWITNEGKAVLDGKEIVSPW